MKDASKILVLENQVIKLYDESNFELESVDNLKNYNHVYINGDHNALTSKIGIEIYENEKLLSGCLIASEGGGTGVFKNSALISYGGIIICCANTIFKLTIPDLQLEWKTKADSATCFGIYSLETDYVIHGELEIIRLDKNGKIIWQKSGRDIWVTAEGIDDFAVHKNYISATDWEYNRYKFDFNGNFLEEYKS